MAVTRQAFGAQAIMVTHGQILHQATFHHPIGRMVVGGAPSNDNIIYLIGDLGSGHTLWKYTYIDGDGSGAGGTWVDRSV